MLGVCRLRGDRGAVGLLRDDPETVAVPWDAGALDLDTDADLDRVASDLGRRA